jgi:hypothetical protein
LRLTESDLDWINVEFTTLASSARYNVQSLGSPGVRDGPGVGQGVHRPALATPSILGGPTSMASITI